MSERKFSVGDRVRIIGAEHDSSDVGEVATVVGVGIGLCANGEVSEGYFVNRPCGDVCPNPTGLSIYRPCHLEPYYDGHEKTSWSSCEWRPKSLERA